MTKIKLIINIYKKNDEQFQVLNLSKIKKTYMKLYLHEY